MSNLSLQNELYTTPVGQILAEKRGTWKVTVLVGHPVFLPKVLFNISLSGYVYSFAAEILNSDVQIEYLA